MIFTGFLKDAATCEFLTDAVDQITDIMFICSVFEKRYLKNNKVIDAVKAIGDRILGRIPPLYAAVLKFSYASRKLFSHGKLLRSLISWRPTDLEDALSDAQRKRNTLQEFADIGFKEATLDTLQGIQADTSLIRETAEVIQREVAPRLQNIQAEQSRARETEKQEVIEARYKEQLRWLQSPSIAKPAAAATTYESNMEKFHPGSADWLLNNGEFIKWRDQSQSVKEG